MRQIESKVIATIVVCAGLGACQTLGDITGTSRDANAQTRPVPSSDAPATILQTARKASPAAPLAGLDASQLLSLWGEPTVRRREAGAELWTYGKPRAGCTVLVYLYPGAGGAMTVARSEALPGGTDAGVVETCARANALAPAG